MRSAESFFFFTLAYHLYWFVATPLSRCDGATGIMAPSVWGSRACFSHTAFLSILPPVSTATRALYAAAASAPATPQSSTGNGAGTQADTFSGNLYTHTPMHKSVF